MDLRSSKALKGDVDDIMVIDDDPNLGSVDIDAVMKKITDMTDEEAAGHSKKSGISLEELKKVAAHLGMVTTRSKIELVKAIKLKVENKKKLEVIEQTNSNLDEGTNFRKDKNTFPRMCNFIMTFPEAIQRSAILGGRFELQSGQVYDRQDIFVDTADKFNSNANSGGLITEHEEYKARNIDPNMPNRSGNITSKIVYTLWKSVVKAYAEVLPKYEQSGHHNGHDFYNYAKGDVDILYLHH